MIGNIAIRFDSILAMRIATETLETVEETFEFSLRADIAPGDHRA